MFNSMLDESDACPHERDPFFLLARELHRLILRIEPERGNGIYLSRLKHAALRISGYVAEVANGAPRRRARSLDGKARTACHTVSWLLLYLHDANAITTETLQPIDAQAKRLARRLAERIENAAVRSTPISEAETPIVPATEELKGAVPFTEGEVSLMSPIGFEIQGSDDLSKEPPGDPEEGAES